MERSINITIPAEIPTAGRLVDLLVRFATACRAAGGRARLGTGEETTISRGTGGRC